MIEITHKQAQRWLRQKLDHHLPDAQWATLQGHLENCSECREYRSRLGTFERDLKRSMRGGWDSAVYHTSEDHSDYAPAVVQRRQRRAVTKRRVMWAATVVLLGLGFLLTGGLERLRSRGQPQSVIEVPPTSTPMPTAAAGEFRGVVAYEASVGTQSDIFLLNPGEPGGPVNLTNHPARDGSPSWSPDGEWMAFLSDRAGDNGQLEVFVTNVAGSRVVQLTDAPDMLWEGPISWSPDGKNLALTGIRLAQGGQSRIYIVPLNGHSEGTGGALESGAYSLPGTRGGFAPEFSPAGSRLAFIFSDGARGGLMLTQLDGSERASVDWAESRGALPASPGSSVEWSPDGASLAYTASMPLDGDGGEQGAQITAVQDLTYSVSSLNDQASSVSVAQSRWSSAYRAVGWTPGGSVMYLEDLDDARADMAGAISGCWQIYTRSPALNGSGGSPFSPGSLCVESGLDRLSWTPDGQWLVTLGRTIEEVQISAPRGLYAMQLASSIDGSSDDRNEARIIRLGDAVGIAGLPVVRPVLKQYQLPLNIDPQPVAPRAEAPSPLDASGAVGEVLFARPQGSGSVIVRMSPDGTGGMLLHSTEEVARCPAFSPDSKRVVFVSGPQNPVHAPQPGPTATPAPASASPDFAPLDTGLPGEDIYVMGRDGANLIRISRPVTRSDGSTQPVSVRYGCPVWSPDGRWLAAPVETPDGWDLAVLPSRGGQVRYVTIGRPAGSTGSRWTPDSSRVLLTHTPFDSDRGPVISAVDIPTASSDPLKRKDLRTLTGWRSISGLEVSPASSDASIASNNLTADAWQIGLIAQYAGSDGSLRAVLRRLSMSSSTAEREIVMLGPDFSPGAAGAPLGIGLSGSTSAHYMRSLTLQRGGLLGWQAENGLGIILRGGPGTAKKTVIHFYDLDTRSLSEIAALDDVLYGAAWSPDGGWIILSAESGLWLVDVQAAREGRAGPLWISPEPVFDLDWGSEY